MDIYALLIIGHLLGTVLAVGGATMIEVHLNKAMAAGMSPDHRSMLGLNFTVLRIGLVLSVFTGLGFIVNMYVNGTLFWLQNPVLWAKMTILLVVVVNALLLQAHKINLYWGSALSFVGWWSIMLLGIFISEGVRFGFVETMITFTLMVVVGAFLLHKVRQYIQSKHV